MRTMVDVIGMLDLADAEDSRVYDTPAVSGIFLKGTEMWGVVRDDDVPAGAWAITVHGHDSAEEARQCFDIRAEELAAMLVQYQMIERLREAFNGEPFAIPTGWDAI